MTSANPASGSGDVSSGKFTITVSTPASAKAR